MLKVILRKDYVMFDELFKLKIVLPLLFLFSFIYIQAQRDTNFTNPEVIKKLVSEGALLIDVRSPQEYRSTHLKQAINVPINEIDNHLKDLGQKDQKIVVYCRSGRRSTRAHSILLAHGFKDVYNLGGMGRWSQE